MISIWHILIYLSNILSFFINHSPHRLANGALFLLQAHDDTEMSQWVTSLKAQSDSTAVAASRSQTLPATSQKDEPKRRSFFTLKKK